MGLELIINPTCGCLKLYSFDTKGAIITEESNYSPGTPGNIVFITESGDTIIAEDMAEVKISDLATAPSFNSMAEFTGILPNGEGGFDNVNFTPAQLIAYVAPMLRLPYEVITSGETITVDDIASKPVQAIMLPNGTLTKSQFTQVNNDITYTGNEFYAGDEIVFIF